MAALRDALISGDYGIDTYACKPRVGADYWVIDLQHLINKLSHQVPYIKAKSWVGRGKLRYGEGTQDAPPERCEKAMGLRTLSFFGWNQLSSG